MYVFDLANTVTDPGKPMPESKRVLHAVKNAATGTPKLKGFVVSFVSFRPQVAFFRGRGDPAASSVMGVLTIRNPLAHVVLVPFPCS